MHKAILRLRTCRARLSHIAVHTAGIMLMCWVIVMIRVVVDVLLVVLVYSEGVYAACRRAVRRVAGRRHEGWMHGIVGVPWVLPANGRAKGCLLLVGVTDTEKD
jgi:hypothetical protein